MLPETCKLVVFGSPPHRHFEWLGVALSRSESDGVALSKVVVEGRAEGREGEMERVRE